MNNHSHTNHEEIRKCAVRFGKDCPNPRGRRCWIDAGKLNREKQSNRPAGRRPDDQSFF